MPGDKKTYYELLEVDENAGNEAIKKARKKLGLLYHPDKMKGNEEDKRAASELMKQINHACDVLSDPIKRADYNRTLKSNQSFNYPAWGDASSSTTSTASFEKYADMFPIHLAANMSDDESLKNLLAKVDINKRRSELEKKDDNGLSVIEIILKNIDNQHRRAKKSLRVVIELLGTTLYRSNTAENQSNFYDYLNTDDRKKDFLAEAVYVVGPNLVNDFLQHIDPEKRSELIYSLWPVLINTCNSISEGKSMMVVLFKYLDQNDYSKFIEELDRTPMLRTYFARSFLVSAFPDKELLTLSRALPKVEFDVGPDNIYNNLYKIIYPYTSGITTNFFGTPSISENAASELLKNLNKLEHKDLESVRSVLLQAVQSVAKANNETQNQVYITKLPFIQKLAQCYEFMATAKPTPGPTPKK